jgi:hypothetical protein
MVSKRDMSVKPEQRYSVSSIFIPDIKIEGFPFHPRGIKILTA